jgi:hypothetical protein
MNEMPTTTGPLEEQPFKITLHLSDGTFVKAYKVPRANTGLPQHSHGYSHTSYIATGSVKVWRDGVYTGTVAAPDGILIAAHTKHFFQTLEDNTTILCIHALTDGEEPDIEDEHVVGQKWELRPPAPPRVPMEGVSFQEEEYDAWLIDAQPLFRQHMAQTGQDPDGAMMKNIPLGRRLANTGVLTVMTARANGRMFGYLLVLMSPTLDEADVMTAHLMLPFASPDMPGVGRRLRQATIEMLRARGVTQVFARAGVRGDGPR